MQENVKQLLRGIIHPETEQNIVDSGIVEQISAREDKITVVLCFAKSRDPFAIRIKTLVEQSLKQAFPQAAEDITVVIKEGTPRAPQPKRESTTTKVGKIVAVASGKGGVGKSTVTANLARCEIWAFAWVCWMPTYMDLRSIRCSTARATCPMPCRRMDRTTSYLP